MEKTPKPMLTKFRGEKYHRLDNNFRLSMPREFANILQETSQGKIVITRGLEHCLWIYPASIYEKFVQRLSTLPRFKKDTMRLLTLYIGSITETELDKQGRIVLPKHLLQYAGIEQEIVLVGEADRLQLWSAANWQRYLEYINTNADDIAERMSDLFEQQTVANGPLKQEKPEEDLSDLT
jgi:MraZ protein